LNAVLNAASGAVERDGREAKVNLEDFLKAIQAGKRAKTVIGKARE
jgi:hypothetical protein